MRKKKTINKIRRIAYTNTYKKLSIKGYNLQMTGKAMEMETRMKMIKEQSERV